MTDENDELSELRQKLEEKDKQIKELEEKIHAESESEENVIDEAEQEFQNEIKSLVDKRVQEALKRSRMEQPEAKEKPDDVDHPTIQKNMFEVDV